MCRVAVRHVLRIHVLHILGAIAVLLLLALPTGKAAASVGSAGSHAPRDASRDAGRDWALAWSGEEEGACEEAEPQELLECGAQIEETLDEPLVISLLRALDVRLTEDACHELLEDVWAQQVCIAGSRECGKMNAGAPLPPPHEWVSSTSNGHSGFASLDLSAVAVRRLGFADGARPFASLDLQPPVPPPRLAGH